MDRRTLVSLVIGALSVACAAGAFNADPIQLTPTVEPNPDSAERSVIHGFALAEKTGEPVTGALVVLQCSCLEGQRETQSGPGGLYRFRDLPPGKYTVQFLFGESNLSRVHELAPGTRARIDIRLDPNNRFVIT